MVHDDRSDRAARSRFNRKLVRAGIGLALFGGPLLLLSGVGTGGTASIIADYFYLQSLAYPFFMGICALLILWMLYDD